MGRTPSRLPQYAKTEDISNWEETADYVIYKDGSNTIAVNGNTGKEESINTNTSTVFQYVFDNIDSTYRGVVFIKPGKYELSTTVTAYCPTMIIGSGPRSTRLFGTMADGSVILEYQGVGGKSGGCVKNLSFKSASGAITGNALYLNDTYNHIVQHLEFYEVDAYCIQLYSCLIQEICNCKFTDTTSGCIIGVEGTSTDIHSNDFEGYDGYGINFDGVFGNYIHNNWFENAATTAGTHVYIHGTTRTCKKNVIYGNVFNLTGDTSSYCIKIDDNGNSCDFTKIIGNSFSNGGDCLNVILLDTNNTLIESNTFEGSNTVMIQANGVTQINNNIFKESTGNPIYYNSNGGMIVGNLFRDCDAPVKIMTDDILITSNYFRSMDAVSLELDTANECAVIGNAFSSSTGVGILIDGSHRNLISGNSIEEGGADGIYLTGNSDDNVIKDNYTRGNNTKGVNIAMNTCNDNHVFMNAIDEGALTDAGTATVAFDNWDQSAAAWIAQINGPAGGR